MCVLCNSFAKFIIKKDKKDLIRLSALQSQTAVALHDKLKQIDSIVLIDIIRKYTINLMLPKNLRYYELSKMVCKL